MNEDATISRTLAVVLVLIIIWMASNAMGQCPDGNCPTPQTQQAAYHGSVCRVRNTIGSATSIGSGVLIRHGTNVSYVLTCGHIFSDGRGKVIIDFPNRTSWGGVIVKCQQKPDLAIIKIKRVQTLRPVVLCPQPVTSGGTLVVWGYPRGGPLRRFRRRLRRPYVGQIHLWGSGEIPMGVSGGPVLDANGNLAGILTHTNNDEFLAVPQQQIQDFVEPVLPSPPVRPGPGGDVPSIALGAGAGLPPQPGQAIAPIADEKPTTDYQALFEQIRTQNIEILARLDKIEKERSIRGPPGEDGKDGEDGTMGPPGPTPIDNRGITMVELDQYAQSNPIYVELYDTQGKIIDETTVSLGGTLKLQLYEQPRGE